MINTVCIGARLGGGANTASNIPALPVGGNR